MFNTILNWLHREKSGATSAPRRKKDEPESIGPTPLCRRAPTLSHKQVQEGRVTNTSWQRSKRVSLSSNRRRGRGSVRADGRWVSPFGAWLQERCKMPTTADKVQAMLESFK